MDRSLVVLSSPELPPVDRRGGRGQDPPWQCVAQVILVFRLFPQIQALSLSQPEETTAPGGTARSTATRATSQLG